MERDICFYIMQHLSLFERVYAMSLKMLAIAKESRFDEVNVLSENRERLVEILSQVQLEIDKKINRLVVGDDLVETVNIIKTWEVETGAILNMVLDIDEIVEKELQEQKSKITQEIASVFKSKEGVKGYNLSSVKK